MRLGLRLFFAFFLINGLAAFFVLRVFMVEIKPSVRKVTEDTLVETAYALATLASADMEKGRLQAGADSTFAAQLLGYTQKPIQAWIWDTRKTTLDLRITVTDARGTVLFDSLGRDQGADYSRWRDVYLTLRGEYGARTTRAVKEDESSSVMYVSAPIMVDGRIAGVLTTSSLPARYRKSSTARSRRFCAAACCLCCCPPPWAVRSPGGLCFTYAGCATTHSRCRPPRSTSLPTPLRPLPLLPYPTCPASWASWHRPWTICASAWRGATISRAMCAP